MGLKGVKSPRFGGLFFFYLLMIGEIRMNILIMAPSEKVVKIHAYMLYPSHAKMRKKIKRKNNQTLLITPTPKLSKKVDKRKTNIPHPFLSHKNKAFRNKLCTTKTDISTPSKVLLLCSFYMDQDQCKGSQAPRHLAVTTNE